MQRHKKDAIRFPGIAFTRSDPWASIMPKTDKASLRKQAEHMRQMLARDTKEYRNLLKKIKTAK